MMQPAAAIGGVTSIVFFGRTLRCGSAYVGAVTPFLCGAFVRRARYYRDIVILSASATTKVRHQGLVGFKLRRTTKPGCSQEQVEHHRCVTIACITSPRVPQKSKTDW